MLARAADQHALCDALSFFEHGKQRWVTWRRDGAAGGVTLAAGRAQRGEHNHALVAASHRPARCGAMQCDAERRN
ncbi:hypothetical protein XFF6990_310057 [Xanthomonas citri pv. fuscans]|nr:hypothetical protein XFF6990_310057 [Xanthomonas citri pv. fuscans]